MTTTSTTRWVEVTPSQFPHEAEGLRLVRALLPDEPPFRAWSNFEFRDGHGKWHEVDLVVLGRRRMHLVELKYYSGTLRGDDHVWRRDGHPAEDSPLKLARRKAQRLAGRLTDELRSWARETGYPLPDTRSIVPFVQEAVFLHHPNLTCLLPMASRQDLFGLDGDDGRDTGLPGIGSRLLEQAEASPHWSIGANRADIVAELMRRIGAVQRRQREAGSWIIDEEPLDEGDDWQEWAAYHRVTRDKRARIRFFIDPPGTSAIERQVRRSLAEHEFRTVSALKHDGVLAPGDIVDTELGTGLVYPPDDGFQRLDLWMADHPEGITLQDQLAIIQQVAEALAYAHRHRVVHRGLNPSAVWVQQSRATGGRRATMQARVGNWRTAGAAGSSATHASPATMLGTAALTAATSNAAATASDTGISPSAFRAPEGIWSPQADRIRLDVFALGALAYFLVGRRPPATSTATLRDRLAVEHGLDLAADLPQVPSRLRQVVLNATRPSVSDRTPDVPTFLEELAQAQRIIAEPDRDDSADPLDAIPGATLAGRFRLDQRLGAGSTAVGLLVTDLKADAGKAGAGKPDAGKPGAGGAAVQRVLKVAVDDKAAERLLDEAQVLTSVREGVRSPRIAGLVEEPITVGGRTALVLQFAGIQTLADALATRGRLSLDLLERYGSDLLEAVAALDAAGVSHRDIKPANLGIAEVRKSKHLMLFDFSLARAAATSIDAGTRGYLDPFLGTGGRERYDSAAERYAAAVVLFEMATGSLPTYGDGASDPVASGGALRIDAAMFDPAVSAPLVTFFTQALAPDAKHRHHTVGTMAAAWRAAFAPVPHTQADDADELAAAVSPETSLVDSGLSARALSAIEPLGVATVGDLVALDPVRLNRMTGAADATRREVKSRARAWRKRLGAELLGLGTGASTDSSGETSGTGTDSGTGTSGTGTASRTGATPSGTLPDVLAAARLLAAPFDAAPTSLRRRAVHRLLGLAPGSDAFVTQGALGVQLGASKPRGGQLIDEMQRAWSDDPACRGLLDALRQVVFAGLQQLGGVATVPELAELIRSVLPGPVAVTEQRARLSTGLLRVALDRAAALDRAEALDERLERRRDRHGRLLTVATDVGLLAAADAAGRRADELAAAALAAGEPLVGESRAAAELRAAFSAALDAGGGAGGGGAGGGGTSGRERRGGERRGTERSGGETSGGGTRGGETGGGERRGIEYSGDGYSGDGYSGDGASLGPARLVRLGAALSQHAAVAGDGSLYHRDLPLDDALRIAVSGLAPGQTIGAQELRDRVRARFPAVPAVPDRARGLDELVERAGLPLVYDEQERAYRPRGLRGPTTGLATRMTLPRSVAGSAATGYDGPLARRLAESIAERSFLALGVPAQQLAAAQGALEGRCGARIVDVTSVLIDGMRRQAADLGMDWETVTAADAAEPGTRAAAGLAVLVSRTIPAVHEAIRAAAGRQAGPVLITEAAPLARYGHLAELAQWSDLTTPRPAAVWVLVPQLHGSTGSLVDGQPLPLAAPGQFVQLDDTWLAAGSADHAGPADSADPAGQAGRTAGRSGSTASTAVTSAPAGPGVEPVAPALRGSTGASTSANTSASTSANTSTGIGTTPRSTP